MSCIGMIISTHNVLDASDIPDDAPARDYIREHAPPVTVLPLDGLRLLVCSSQDEGR